MATGGVNLRCRHAGKVIDAGGRKGLDRADRFHADDTVQGFRERWTLIGQMRLRADERDRPGKPVSRRAKAARVKRLRRRQ